MARHIGLAAIIAAAATTLAACAVGGPPQSQLAAARIGIAPSSAPATTITVPPPSPTTGEPSGNVTINGIPGLPSLSVNIPDLGTISLGTISLGGISVTGGSLPAGFPTPPGATSIGAVSAGSSIAAQLKVSDPAGAYNFWLSALPHAGYTVGSSGRTEINGVLHAGMTFGGHGYQPVSAIAIVGTTVTIGFVGSGDHTGPTSGKVPGTVTTWTPPAGTILIDNNDDHLARACTAGSAVNIVGSSDTLTLTGECGPVNVIGSDDHIIADTATIVNVTGSDNDITVHRGHPEVNRVGANNDVHVG